MPDLPHDSERDPGQDLEVEARIRAGLAELVAHGPDPATRTERIDRHAADLRDRLTRRRQFLAGAAATTVAVGAGLTWSVVRSRDGTTTSLTVGGPTTGTQGSSSDWIPIGPAPLSDRRGALATWAGDRLIVWGGVTGVGTPSDGLGAPPDGAAWLPGEQRWQMIARAPAGVTEGAFAVWTGSELVVGPLEADSQAPWNHDVSAGDAQYGLAAYDPAADSWRYVAPVGPDPVRARQATMVGDRLLIADRSARSGAFLGPAPVSLVDPTSGATGIRGIGAGPFEESPYPDASGEVALTAIDGWVVGITNWDRQPWVHDLEQFSWRQAASPPDTDSLHLMPATAIGDRVVVHESSGPQMWSFDPAVDGDAAWQALAPNPIERARWSYDPVWSGSELFVPGAAYDPAADTWRAIPAPPRGEDRQRSLQARWTGDALLLFGGEEYTCADGADCDREPGPETLDGWLLRDP